VSADPLRTVWDALERAGCNPHGRPWDFRARCPVHDGDNVQALHVSVGADGRGVLWCFARQCSIESIVGALDIDIPDLFPAGHHHARRFRLPDARRSEFEGPARTLVNTLAAIERLGADWYASLRVDCAYCGSPAAIVQVDRHGVSFSCPGDADAEALGYAGCTFDQFTQALAGRLHDRGEAA
jgi:hypothetical protein